ncbi:hypothetical protein [Macromonas bipunctata]|uniref:hypothetical protein n=1 Tax=Macromonas bipunctata TaxID=183670 RepID=UPI0014764D90|nr:hypothetical protein [Macromonas bipunctata]
MFFFLKRVAVDRHHQRKDPPQEAIKIQLLITKTMIETLLGGRCPACTALARCMLA